MRGGAVRIAFPLPASDFDPTETAVPWRALRDAGHELVFATPDGVPARADHRVLEGTGLWPWTPFLQARSHAVRLYGEMAGHPAFQAPLRYEQLDASSLDGLVLTGGHAPAMRPYLESLTLQTLAGTLLESGRVVGALCHGVLIPARAVLGGRSAIHDRRVTALLASQEYTAWALTGLWLGRYYRTYPQSVEAEVTAALADPGQFQHGPFSLLREGPERPEAGFVVRDRNLLTARSYGDAYRFADVLVGMLAEGGAGRTDV